ncbi:seryl-tRNA synthetase [Punctularia strigosozonata HHB-11173 SS5]|uniref:seryl-tRNA synthetase n=1 Tax=Punctularia strigosozonata (strain HHB-11173) TaxID=741275 RepID=UPI000441701D|nr:seryl-tRNA synthetase [Punctularia strigosozonata HHB-11173 SS5]EIN14010.1 seryl-tRNA synthetase [Punctularia strigosozonata HHB-11173 SS5]
MRRSLGPLTSTRGYQCRSYATKRLAGAASEVSSLPPPRLRLKTLSESPDAAAHNAATRKAQLEPDTFIKIASLYTEQKELQSAYNTKVHVQSTVGDQIRTIRDLDQKQAAIEKAKRLKSELSSIDSKLSETKSQLLQLALSVPNDTHPSTPLGPESAAVTLCTHGPEPMPQDSARDHVAVARSLDLLDLEAGSSTTGSSWYYLRNEGAMLELALTNYALSIALKHGFTFVTTPDVVRSDIAARCGFQPRDRDASQIYHLEHTNPQLVLAGTAEIPLAGMLANKIFTEDALPIKVVGLGKAFRAEAGARGADTRGLYRVHQFQKLELFAATTEDESEAMMEELRLIQTEIFEGLGFPFRILDMPTEELGASAYRKYDMEAWMPGRGAWGEISSTSNCTDYQARRLHIRYRRTVQSQADASGLPFVHTLNGTAAAIPRLIVALLENGAIFDEAGSICGMDLPEVLRPFWIGTSTENKVRWR